MNFKLDTRFLNRLLIHVLVVLGFIISTHSIALATDGGIDPSDKWAWSDEMGWINLYNSGTILVKGSKIEGYGRFCNGNNPCSSPPASYISFDCATSPYSPSDYCGTVSYNVYNNAGTLYGWAWSDAIGWISFCGGSGNSSVCPGATGSVDYKVTINTSNPNKGDFNGWAWNDKVGWISFNCNDGGTCVSSNYKVHTSWTAVLAATGTMTSVTYDTGKSVNYNSIIWKGSAGSAGATVGFQLATSDCPNAGTNPPTCPAGTWTFLGPGGTSGSSDVYTAAAGTPVPIVGSYHKNNRYYRYKVFLYRPAAGTSPRVDDVVVNWSP